LVAELLLLSTALELLARVLQMDALVTSRKTVELQYAWVRTMTRFSIEKC
jgi:hypothetical protein